MPSVNTFITALVAGLAIGAQAGPCRPHSPSSSVIQSQVTTTQHVESAAGTSAAYTDAVSISESGASLSTAVQVTSSTEAESKPTTTDENETTTASYPASESSSATTDESKATTTAYPAVESTSVTSGSLTTESKPEPTSAIPSLATDSTTRPTSSADEIISSALPTTAESSAALYTTSEAETVPSTTSEAEVIPSTTSSEPKTTLDISTIAPTTTSAYPTTTTSQASTTTSAAASSECPPLSELSCGLVGLYTESDGHLIQVLYDTDIDACWGLCANDDNCKSIGITTSDQCELYDTAVSGMGFSARAGWYYSVYDACCHQATTD
ncbi:uncharacterized protein FTOL_03777 [Fusarium torulosum]|uniref:Apple domain-containing protein n=1 Tax=Fusarium torulosum TaxID=33205 RepID=A0AAE8M4J0_9HYPO|nr:uncharacterized protein FTOL_03777 [Fusarium torulosum]